MKLTLIRFMFPVKQYLMKPRADYHTVLIRFVVEHTRNTEGDRIRTYVKLRLINLQSITFNHSVTPSFSPQAGFEPTTQRLTAHCSTAELLKIKVSER